MAAEEKPILDVQHLGIGGKGRSCPPDLQYPNRPSDCRQLD
ncbi:hypothetical protein ACP0HM_29325 [Escherichia coli]